MTVLTVYGIKSCDKCRRACSFLDKKAIEYRFHDLRDDGLDDKTLERWARNIDWEKLLNKRSLTWRKLPEADRGNVTREKALMMMLEQPTLVKRPVIEAKGFIAVGFSEQQFAELLTRRSSDS